MNHTSAFITIFFAFFPCFVIAQAYQHQTWVLGYPTQIPNQPNNDEYGGIYIKFDNTSFKIEEFDIYGGQATSTANDSSGNVLFYTNGCSIYNQKNEIMPNGDSINNLTYQYQNECAFGGISYITNCTLTLPLPGDDSKFLLFYPQVIRTSDTTGVWNRLLLTKVDMSNWNGNVTEKNIIIIDNDSLWDAASAVKHGNGRDWWIIIPRGRNRDFWEILIDPKGIKQKNLIKIPPPYTTFNVKYKVELDTPPYVSYHETDEYQLEAGPAQVEFSPDGTKLCRIMRSGELEIYDFDRCSGTIKLRRSLIFSPYITTYGDIMPACSMAISPNSRFIYFTNTNSLYQFDMCEENILTGTYQLIANWDGFALSGAFPTNFFIMRNAPDGKIYIDSPNSVKSLHVIHKPNLPGQLCEFEQRGVTLNRFITWPLNYFPNFNLYDIPGSICDSLGINNPHLVPTINLNTVNIYPNPADPKINIFIPKCNVAVMKIWNIAGQLISSLNEIPGGVPFEISTSGWPSGVYFFSLFFDSNEPITKKVIISH